MKDRRIARRLTTTLVCAFGLMGGARAQEQLAELVNPLSTLGHAFGSSIALSGDTLAIGVPAHNVLTIPNVGAGVVFVRQQGAWVEQAEIHPSPATAAQPYTSFSDSMALDGDVLVVGAPFFLVPGNGFAEVHTRSGTLWTRNARLQPASGAAFDSFGAAVDVSGDTIVIGAPGDDRPGLLNSGAVYVFERQSPGGWSQSQVIYARNAAAGDLFGGVLTLERDTLIVGAPYLPPRGVVFAFERVGQTFVFRQRIVAPVTSSHRFGVSLSVEGNTLAVGATGTDSQAGNAHIYSSDGSGWTPGQVLTGLGGDIGDQFGKSLSLAGHLLVVGAPRDDRFGAGSGVTHLFRNESTGWVHRTLLPPPNAAANFGGEVLATPDELFIGALGFERSSVVTYSSYTGSNGCFGDGSGAICPCGNNSTPPGRGCFHSAGVGMELRATGSRSVSADDLRLTATGVPPGNTGLFACGAPQSSAPLMWFDGLLCMQPPFLRFQAQHPSTDTVIGERFVAMDPTGTFLVPGTEVVFQYLSRDNQSGLSPCGLGAVSSPAVRVLMAP